MSSPRFPAVLDEVTVRLVAAVVLVLAVLALAAQQWWLYAVLALDFTLRAGFGPRRSPIGRLVQRWVRPRVGHAARPTPGAPKRFAAAVGAVLTVAASALWILSATTGSPAAGGAVVAIGAIMVIFPALESLLGVCVGCHVFAVLMRLGVIPEEVCLDCADISRRVRQTSTA